MSEKFPTASADATEFSVRTTYKLLTTELLEKNLLDHKAEYLRLKKKKLSASESASANLLKVFIRTIEAEIDRRKAEAAADDEDDSMDAEASSDDEDISDTEAFVNQTLKKGKAAKNYAILDLVREKLNEYIQLPFDQKKYWVYPAPEKATVMVGGHPVLFLASSTHWRDGQKRNVFFTIANDNTQWKECTPRKENESTLLYTYNADGKGCVWDVSMDKITGWPDHYPDSHNLKQSDKVYMRAVVPHPGTLIRFFLSVGSEASSSFAWFVVTDKFKLKALDRKEYDSLLAEEKE